MLPEIDMRTAAGAGLEALSDIEVLRIAAMQARVLVSQDRRTMPQEFELFVRETASPGVILLRGGVSIRSAIEELALIWHASEAEGWVNRLVWIPL